MANKVPVNDSKSTREKVFDFLVTYKREHHGDSPSNRDIAQACSLSISTVKYHLLKLEVANRVQVLGRRRIHIVGSTWDLPIDETELESAIDEMDGDNSAPARGHGAHDADKQKGSDSARMQRKDAFDSPSSHDSSTPPYS